MKASQTRIKNSIAEKGVTIDVGAGLLAKNDDAVDQTLCPHPLDQSFNLLNRKSLLY
jgi:hypothetical protein